MVEPEAILARLIGVEGVTGNEERVLETAAMLSNELGLDPDITPDGLVVRVRGTMPGRSLLQCSHLDTVPAGEGWTVPPFEATIKHGMMYGRGAVDARSICAAILLAGHRLKTEGLAKGEWVGALSIGEEGNHSSMERLVHVIGNVDVGVVGEPTNMNIATAQSGLIVLRLIARGVQDHAARNQGRNAALILAKDIVHLDELRPPRWHSKLGRVRITPTRINAGVADNVTPATATALVDVRTTPVYEHNELISIINAAVESDVEVVADQWISCETPHGHGIRQAVSEALPDVEIYASNTTSDWVFLERAGIPAIKIGPGDPAFSHTADERIAIGEWSAGVDGYVRLARAYLENDTAEANT